MFFYRVAEPNEALIITGFRAHRGSEGDAAGLGFKIIVGKGALVMWGLQKVRRLSLDIHEAELDLQCVTTQGIPVGVKAVVIYKIADDYQSIANAARRFLDQEEQMDVKVHNVFAGHLRSIVGTMTIEDHTGYVENLGMPEAARVAKDARIAQASADREATEREQEAEALKAAARSSSQIRQAEVTAEAQRAEATAEQAGPLAGATARQNVVIQETKVAQLEAERTEQRLQAEVRKPADAEAYKTVTIAVAERDARISQAEAHAREVELQAQADAKRVKLEADAQATQTKQLGQAEAAATEVRGEAEGAATRAKGMAEAAAIRARAEALRDNQEAVINQQIVEELPQIVAEGAKAFGNIDHLTVLNGGEGMTDLLNHVVGAGVSTVPMLRQLLSPTDSNGDSTSRKPDASSKKT